MRFVILQNGNQVVGRYNTAAEARTRIIALLRDQPATIFEVATVVRRVYMQVEERPTRTLVDEVITP